jgi:hypothetical protein
MCPDSYPISCASKFSNPGPKGELAMSKLITKQAISRKPPAVPDFKKYLKDSTLKISNMPKFTKKLAK